MMASVITIILHNIKRGTLHVAYPLKKKKENTISPEPWIRINLKLKQRHPETSEREAQCFALARLYNDAYCLNKEGMGRTEECLSASPHDITLSNMNAELY